MTNEKMEQRLASALEKTAPDDMSGVLSRCEARKGTVISMTTKKTVNRKWTTLAAACLDVGELVGLDDARHDVEGEGMLLASDVEGHALVDVDRAEVLGPGPHLVEAQLRQLVRDGSQ